ncbi:nuclear transcription factor Y subunit B-3-like [Musa acuminata AAA Group]|uniref:nuclear transcription factor Y subunit B-3 n=1 Tax=Musa acuminata AAA Group TaxID=214697 RepID=UPI0031E37F7B
MVDSDNESGGQNHAAGRGELCSPREQDRFLPIANVGRIMKKALPANAKISKDAKETVQECVSEFISFITGEASEKCQREKRKTVNGDDLIWAMTTLGFEDYVQPLKVYLQKFRELEGEKLVSSGFHKDSGGSGGSTGGIGSNDRGFSAGGSSSVGASGSAGGMMMAMRQPLHGPSYGHQVGKTSSGGRGSSSSSAGIGRHGRV